MPHLHPGPCLKVRHREGTWGCHLALVTKESTANHCFLKEESKWSPNSPFVYPKGLMSEHFHPQQKPSNCCSPHSGSCAEVLGILEHVTCKFLHLSGEKCLILSYHKVKAFFSHNRSERIFILCCTSWTIGRERTFNVSGRGPRKSKDSNKSKFSQLNLSLLL